MGHGQEERACARPGRMLPLLLRLASCVGASNAVVLAGSAGPAPRALLSKGRAFVDPATGVAVQLRGADVVMKGAPWIPLTDVVQQPVHGTGDWPEGSMGDRCDDRWFTNYTCTTFSKADALHFQAKGWNFVRLGVVWAGGQPTPEPQLDPEFERRLGNFLDLCHEHGIHVLLDVHEDSVGTATCGEGVPPWLSELATPGQVGKALTPLLDILNETSWVPDATQQKCKLRTLGECAAAGLWDGRCWTNDTETWTLFAGQADYNVKNPCCQRYNGGGSQWSRLAATKQAQDTVLYLFHTIEGRTHYATYMGLLAKAVRDKPAAIGIELMNEPPVADLRIQMYETWKLCYDTVRKELPDIAVGVMDAGEGVWSQDNFIGNENGAHTSVHVVVIPGTNL